MNSFEKVNLMLRQNNGYLTSKDANKNGIENKTLQRMVKRGQLERVAHGLYTSVDIFLDPFYVTQYRCPKGIFSHLTAMYLHGYSDRYPIKTTITIPTGYNSKLLTDENYVFYYNSLKIIELGVIVIKTESDMPVRAFDIERTICDCLKHIDKMDKDLVLTGLKRYLRTNNRNNIKLIDYAKVLKIENVVRRYLEVL